MNTLSKLMAGESVSYADLLQDQYAVQLAMRDSMLAQVKASVIEMTKLYDAEVARLTAENQRLRGELQDLQSALSVRDEHVAKLIIEMT